MRSDAVQRKTTGRDEDSCNAVLWNDRQLKCADALLIRTLHGAALRRSSWCLPSHPCRDWRFGLVGNVEHEAHNYADYQQNGDDNNGHG